MAPSPVRTSAVGAADGAVAVGTLQIDLKPTLTRLSLGAAGRRFCPLSRLLLERLFGGEVCEIRPVLSLAEAATARLRCDAIEGERRHRASGAERGRRASDGRGDDGREATIQSVCEGRKFLSRIVHVL